MYLILLAHRNQSTGRTQDFVDLNYYFVYNRIFHDYNLESIVFHFLVITVERSAFNGNPLSMAKVEIN